MIQAFPQTETNFLLTAPAGKLEVLATPFREDVSLHNAVAVICHPHPLFGGTMTNKIVTTMARAFGDLGLRTVRFNFRGVGKSTGQFNEGVGELQDLLTVISWAKTTCPGSTFWLAGFSFGAAVSAHAATQMPVAQLISIAPPVPRFYLPELPSVTCPWLVVQGEQDDVVLPRDVYAWVETRNPQPRLVRVPDAGHFFHGKLMVLRHILETELATTHG